MVVLRSLCRSASAWLRSWALPSPAVTAAFSSPATPAPLLAASPGAPRDPPYHPVADCRLGISTGVTRSVISSVVVRVPEIEDPEILDAVEDLLANDWDHLHLDVVYGVKEALSSSTTDEAGKQVLANVLRAAETVEEISRMIVPLKTELDGIVRRRDKGSKRRCDELRKALQPLCKRGATLLDSFGPEESYLRHKVKTEFRNNLKLRSIVVVPVANAEFFHGGTRGEVGIEEMLGENSVLDYFSWLLDIEW